MPSGNEGPALQLGPAPRCLPLPGPSHCSGDCWSLCMLYGLEGGGAQRGLEGCEGVCCVDSPCLCHVMCVMRVLQAYVREVGMRGRKWASGEHLSIYVGTRVGPCAEIHHGQKGPGSYSERPLK